MSKDKFICTITHLSHKKEINQSKSYGFCFKNQNLIPSLASQKHVGVKNNGKNGDTILSEIASTYLIIFLWILKETQSQEKAIILMKVWCKL